MNRLIWILLLALLSGCLEDAEAFSRRPGVQTTTPQGWPDAPAIAATLPP